MNWRAVATIFNHEMARFYRTLWESLASPVMSTVLLRSTALMSAPEGVMELAGTAAPVG